MNGGNVTQKPVVMGASDAEIRAFFQPPELGALALPAPALMFRMMRVGLAAVRKLEMELAPFDLTPPQYLILHYSFLQDGPIQRELAQQMVVSKGHISQQIAKLEKRGLIERQKDGRSARIFLTEAGRALYREAVPLHTAAMESHFAPLSRAEQHMLYIMLAKLNKAHEVAPTSS